MFTTKKDAQEQNRNNTQLLFKGTKKYPVHISTQEAKPVTFPNLQNSSAPWKSENAQMKRWGFTTFTS